MTAGGRRGSHTRALEVALRAAQLPDTDKAAAQLARQYAAALDAAPVCPDCGAGAPAVLADLGPKMLAALTALGMTSAGRGKPAATTSPAPAGGALKQLRDAAQDRRGGAR